MFDLLLNLHMWNKSGKKVEILVKKKKNEKNSIKPGLTKEVKSEREVLIISI